MVVAVIASLAVLACVAAWSELRALRRSPFHEVIPGAHARLLREGRMPNVEVDELLASVIPIPEGLGLPPSSAGPQSDSVDEPVGLSEGPVPTDGRWFDVTLPAGLAAGTGVVDWLHVDENVLDAVGQWTHTELRNGFDLWRTFQDKGYKLNTGGFAIKLRGHVAEAEIHDQLASWAGEGLTIPEASNNPVVDMSLDGHDFNVKVGPDAATIAEHLRNHPDVPVVVNVDMDGLPPEALHVDMSQPFDSDVLAHHSVVVADGLVLSDLHEQMADAIGPALHGFDMGDLADAAGDVSIPVLGSVIRVVRSGIREQQLLQHHGNKGRAMRNVATDAGVVGAGVAGGGVLGVGIGALIDMASFGATGGLGITVIGPMVGSALGGLFGNKKAAQLRSQPLTRAREDAGRATLAYDTAVTEAVNAAQKEWATSTVPTAEGGMAQMHAVLSERMSWTLVRARQELADSEASLEAETRTVLSRRLDEVNKGRLPLALVARGRQRRWQMAAKGAETGTGQTAALLDVLCAVDGGTDIARGLLGRTARRRARTLAAVTEAIRRSRALMVATRAETLKRLSQEQDRLTCQVRTATHPAAEKVWAAGERVRQELVATGQRAPEWVAENLPSVPRPVAVPAGVST